MIWVTIRSSWYDENFYKVFRKNMYYTSFFYPESLELQGRSIHSRLCARAMGIILCKVTRVEGKKWGGLGRRWSFEFWSFVHLVFLNHLSVGRLPLSFIWTISSCWELLRYLKDVCISVPFFPCFWKEWFCLSFLSKVSFIQLQSRQSWTVVGEERLFFYAPKYYVWAGELNWQKTNRRNAYKFYWMLIFLHVHKGFNIYKQWWLKEAMGLNAYILVLWKVINCGDMTTQKKMGFVLGTVNCGKVTRKIHGGN